MSIRAALLTNETGPAHGTMLAALTHGTAVSEVRTIERASGALFGTVLRLLAYRPDLVIADDRGSSALVAALYRLAVRRSRLLVRATGPARPGLLGRLAVRRADCVLADEDGFEALRYSRARVVPLSPPQGLGPYLSCPLPRGRSEAVRIAYVGPLSPQSGAAEILQCVIAWAERNPHCPVELEWIGDGDLAGVLDAQPLPSTVSQRFPGTLAAEPMAAVFATCGVLLLSPKHGPGASPVAAALAAGMVVVASREDASARYYIGEDGPGWLFDPRRPEKMLKAVTEVLDSPPETLADLRAEGRARVHASASQAVADRLRTVLATVMAAGAAEPGLRGQPTAAGPR